MIGVGVVLLAVGLMCLLYGGIYFRSGRADAEQERASVVLQNLRFSGRIFLWLGVLLTVLGLGSAVIGGVIELVS